MKYKFLEFDEVKAIAAYDESTGQGCYDQCLHLMKYQHSIDKEIMLKLLEIIELQKIAMNEIKYQCQRTFNTVDPVEVRKNEHVWPLSLTLDTLAAVEEKMKGLGE